MANKKIKKYINNARIGNDKAFNQLIDIIKTKYNQQTNYYCCSAVILFTLLSIIGITSSNSF